MVIHIRHPLPFSKHYQQSGGINARAFDAARGEVNPPLQQNSMPLLRQNRVQNTSLQVVLHRQKEYYTHRATIYEMLKNHGAAIASYKKAAYYEPSDMSIYNKINQLKMERMVNKKV